MTSPITPSTLPAAKQAYEAGLEAHHQGDADKAVRHYQEAIALDATYLAPRNNLGALWLTLGQAETAIACLRDALAIDAASVDALINLGVALHTQWKKAGLDEHRHEAAQVLRQAAEHAPAHPAAHAVLGDVLAEQQQHPAAIAAYQQACRNRPDDAELRRKLSRLLGRFVPDWHFRMLADAARNDAFEQALAQTINADSVVLDIGTGSGLLALMAARQGAAQVYACEQSAYVADAARQVIADNGFNDKIDVVPGMSTGLAADHFQPKPNVLVAEIFDSALIGEGALPAFRHALDHLCAEGCQVIPASAQLKMALLQCDPLARVNPLATVKGFDLSAFDIFRPPHDYTTQDLSAYPYHLLSAPVDLLHFNFQALPDAIPEYRFEQLQRQVTVTQPGQLQGVVIWFDMALTDSIRLSSDPARGNNHWGQAVYFFDRHDAVEPGENLTLTLHYNDTRLWLERGT